MHNVYLSLGSNLGDRKAAMDEAISKIRKTIGEIVRQSSFLETEPWGFESTHRFVNACVRVSTTLTPRQLLEQTQRIEREMGRIHKSVGGRYEDRIIDIDILLYDNVCIDEPWLKIPHPLMNKREFVMTPLREILE